MRVFGLDETMHNALLLASLVKRRATSGFARSTTIKAVSKRFAIVSGYLVDHKRCRVNQCLKEALGALAGEDVKIGELYT